MPGVPLLQWFFAPFTRTGKLVWDFPAFIGLD